MKSDLYNNPLVLSAVQSWLKEHIFLSATPPAAWPRWVSSIRTQLLSVLLQAEGDMWRHIPSDPVWAREQMAAGKMMDTLSHNNLTEGSRERKEWWIFAGDSLPLLIVFVTFSVTPTWRVTPLWMQEPPSPEISQHWAKGIIVCTTFSEHSRHRQMASETSVSLVCMIWQQRTAVCCASCCDALYRTQWLRPCALTLILPVLDHKLDWGILVAQLAEVHACYPASLLIFPTKEGKSPKNDQKCCTGLLGVAVSPSSQLDAPWMVFGLWGPFAATTPPSALCCTHTDLSSGFSPQRAETGRSKWALMSLLALFGTWKTCGFVRHGGHTRHMVD